MLLLFLGRASPLRRDLFGLDAGSFQINVFEPLRKAGEIVFRLGVIDKDFLDFSAKHPRDLERQRQRRVVPSRLDRINTLSGNLQLLGKQLLGPPEFGAQVF
jgi:hypothetical protein